MLRYFGVWRGLLRGLLVGLIASIILCRQTLAINTLLMLLPWESFLYKRIENTNFWVRKLFWLYSWKEQFYKSLALLIISEERVQMLLACTVSDCSHNEERDKINWISLQCSYCRVSLVLVLMDFIPINAYIYFNHWWSDSFGLFRGKTSMQNE